MSISKGGQSVKPYVGSKEVKEAYVGSQKVYTAAPPVYYGFLGAENDYVKADWCQLTTRANIVKESGVYRIAINSTDYDSSFRGVVTITDIKTNKLKFIAKRGGTESDNKTTVYFKRSVSDSDIISSRVINAPSGNYSLFSFDVPQGTNIIQIIGPSSRYVLENIYLDEIRFETE